MTCFVEELYTSGKFNKTHQRISEEKFADMVARVEIQVLKQLSGPVPSGNKPQ